MQHQRNGRQSLMRLVIDTNVFVLASGLPLFATAC